MSYIPVCCKKSFLDGCLYLFRIIACEFLFFFNVSPKMAAGVVCGHQTQPGKLFALIESPGLFL